MRFAQITLSEPQAAFVVDAALLLAAALKHDTEMTTGVIEMINESIGKGNYNPLVIAEVVQMIEALSSAWEQPEGQEMMMPPPPEGLVS